MLAIGEKAGRCPNCGGWLLKETDPESRKWAKCFDCNIRIPLDSGYRLVEIK